MNSSKKKKKKKEIRINDKHEIKSDLKLSC